MNVIQLVLLLIFAAAIVISFVLRLRMGAINGAVERGEKKDEAKEIADKCFHYAVICAGIGAAAIVLCMIVGLIQKLL